MKRRGTSIRIYLADGTPEGLRIVERSNWTGRALMVSRAQYAEVRPRPEFDRPGVYLLRGQPKHGGFNSRIYIGEADTARSRIDRHVRTKDFWDELILFTSKDEALNKAHVRYLESRLLDLANQAKQAEIDNSNAPQLPSLSEPERDDAEAFLEDMLLIYPVLGVLAFEQATPPSGASESSPLLYLKAEAAKGTGRDTSEGFVVYRGAKVRLRTTPSIHRFLLDLREALINEAVLVRNGEQLELGRDYRFNSPSTAAGVLLGRNTNGRIKWKDETGRTLKEIQDLALEQMPIQGSPNGADTRAEADEEP